MAARTGGSKAISPRALWIRQSLGLEPSEGGIQLHGDGLVFSALKPSSDGRGVIIRCYNPGDEAARGEITFDAPVRAAIRVTADEHECGPALLAPDRRTVPVLLTPGEILSLAIEPE